VNEERAFARFEIENARAAVQRVEEALQEHEKMSEASGKQVWIIPSSIMLSVLFSQFFCCMRLEKKWVFSKDQSSIIDCFCHSAYCFFFLPFSWLFQRCLHNFWCMERLESLMHYRFFPTFFKCSFRCSLVNCSYIFILFFKTNYQIRKTLQ